MAIKPYIFAACDKGYYETYGEALENSAKANGHECEVYCTGKTVDSELSKIWHTHLRFHLLPKILERHGPTLVLDTDSIIRSPVTIDDDYELGLYVEDRPDYERQVKAGCFYIVPSLMPLALKIKEWLNFQCVFDDQIVLNRFCVKPNTYKLQKFDDSFFSWDFNPKAAIWTGKGERKFADAFTKEIEYWRINTL